MINTYPYDGIKITPVISIKKITPLQSENNSPYADEKITSPWYPYIGIKIIPHAYTINR
ncbi:hypothetical protein IJD44_05460 [bacterium]|nr:hypothetical protein [bacterium]